VTVRWVKPVLAMNTANAGVRVVLCHASGAPVGVAVGGPGRFCSSVRRPAGQRLGGPGDRLVVVVRPKQPGVVDIAGVTVKYRTVLRAQRQVTGVAVTVRVS
jgi:hypothetical protein